jgi:hypothetical protein
VQGRWALREPVQEPAEPDAVARLSTALGGVLVTDYLDAGAPEKTGVEVPAAEVVVEADVRSADGSARVMRQVVRVGRAADLSGKGVYAAVERAGAMRTVVLSSAALDAINPDPAAYVARRALGGAAADVGKLTVTVAGGAARPFQRTLDGWTAAGDSAGREDVQGIEAALKLLTEEKAQTVAIADEWPGGFAPRGSIALESAGGTPMGMVEIGVVTAGGKECPAVRGGKVWRIYGEGLGRQVLEWIAR